MGYLVGLALPVVLCTLAFLMGRHELRLYRNSRESGWDLFAYSKGRLWRRMTGVGLLAGVGLTLAALEVLPASTSWGASLYLALLCTEVLGLLVLPLVDLWETSRTAKPKDLMRQADPDRRTRSRPRRPQ